jgi:hypothetical protein
MANQNEYGLFQLLDLELLNPNQAAATVDSGLLTSGIIMDAARHNADVDAMLRLFTETTSEYQLEVTQAGGGRSQPLDENGRAIPVKPKAPYTVAFPILGSGSALGFNYLTRERMTVRDLAKGLSTMYRGDLQWVTDHLLAALFTNASYSYRDITGKGALTVYGLANADSVTYYRTTTNALATDTHYFATASAIADNANVFSTMKAELLEHPDNAGDVIAFISTSLVATATALAEFNPVIDTDIERGTGTDRLVGTLGIVLPPGAELKGKTDSGVWIVEWPILPAGYIVAITTQGRRPLARRVFEQPSLQGFKATGTREDFPYFEEQWQRWEGYGALNRVGGLVQRVGDGSYAIPTGYTVPMH